MLISRGQPDFNIVSFRAGGKGEVFVIANALKSFILKIDMVTSIFLTFCRRLWLSNGGRKDGRLTVVHWVRTALSSFFIAALCISRHSSLAERVEQAFLVDEERFHIATIRLTRSYLKCYRLSAVLCLNNEDFLPGHRLVRNDPVCVFTSSLSPTLRWWLVNSIHLHFHGFLLGQ